MSNNAIAGESVPRHGIGPVGQMSLTTHPEGSHPTSDSLPVSCGAQDCVACPSGGTTRVTIVIHDCLESCRSAELAQLREPSWAFGPTWGPAIRHAQHTRIAAIAIPHMGWLHRKALCSTDATFGNNLHLRTLIGRQPTEIVQSQQTFISCRVWLRVLHGHLCDIIQNTASPIFPTIFAIEFALHVFPTKWILVATPATIQYRAEGGTISLVRSTRSSP